MPTVPSTVYHYTTAKGLLGIIETGAIRATDVEFLNDARELEFGRDELYEALMVEAERIAPEANVSMGGGAEYSRATVMRSAAGHLRPGGMFLQKQAHAAYAACFCEDGDLLSQWRAYAVDGGFAIGFTREVLAAIRPIPTMLRSRGSAEPSLDSAGPPLEVRLVKVGYGPAAMDLAVRRVLEKVAPKPIGFPGTQGFVRAQTIVLPELASIKHEAFTDEREWRLLVVGTKGLDTVEFRSGRLGLIPYMSLTLPETSIAEVIVGPGPSPDVRERGVSRFLAARGIEGVLVRHSDAPYRS